MNANYGIMPSLTDEEIEASGMKRNVIKRDKKIKYRLLSERALKELIEID
jgi:folate-dependent tRNA-U54 methylase TrmFO/GidA